MLYRRFHVSPDKEFVFCEVLKNGSNSAVRLFPKKLGWHTKKNLDDVNISEAKFFTFIRDPIERWIAGFTQYALGDKLDFDKLFSEENTIKMLPGLFDAHTMPISHTHMPIYNLIEFLPMDREEFSIVEVGNAWAEEVNAPFRFDELGKFHEAKDQKKVYYEQVKEFIHWKEESIQKYRLLDAFLHYDIEKYDAALQKYSSKLLGETFGYNYEVIQHPKHHDPKKYGGGDKNRFAGRKLKEVYNDVKVIATESAGTSKNSRNNPNEDQIAGNPGNPMRRLTIKEKNKSKDK